MCLQICSQLPAIWSPVISSQIVKIFLPQKMFRFPLSRSIFKLTFLDYTATLFGIRRDARRVRTLYLFKITNIWETVESNVKIS